MNRRGRIEKALGAVADAVAVLDRELPEVGLSWPRRTGWRWSRPLRVW